MINIVAEKVKGSHINVTPMSIKRDWMDATPEKHAYRCFPVTQANMIGWTLSCDIDIKFIWNGVNDTSSENVTILEGGDIVYTGRGQSSISFTTGLVFKSPENISLLAINPSNYFNKDFETISSIISTSWYDNEFPLAIKALTPNKEITIKSGEPLATIIPVSLTNMDKSCIELVDYVDNDNSRSSARETYGEAAQKLNTAGVWTDWYRDAVNEKGESVGSHEIKVLRLNVQDNTQGKS